MFGYDQMLKNTYEYHKKINVLAHAKCKQRPRVQNCSGWVYAQLHKANMCLFFKFFWSHSKMSIEYDGIGVDGSFKKPYSTFTFANYLNIWDCRVQNSSNFNFFFQLVSSTVDSTVCVLLCVCVYVCSFGESNHFSVSIMHTKGNLLNFHYVGRKVEPKLCWIFEFCSKRN